MALVAEIEEDWTTPVDIRMEAIEGLVFRRALSEVKHQVHEENVNSMKADMAQFKAEQGQADRKPSSRKRSSSSTRRYKRNCRRPKKTRR